MSKKLILFVRHGKTDWNGQFRFQGKSDIPLNDEGRMQARKLSLRLLAEKDFRIFSSPMARAVETADIIAASRSECDIQLREGLAEMGFGSWEGRTLHEIEADNPEELRQWREDPFTSAPSGGELFSALLPRVTDVLDEIRSLEDSRIVVVSHGGIIRAALVALLNIPPAASWRMKISNASLTGVDLGRSRTSLSFLNDELHSLLSEEEIKKIFFSA
ncbi:MAG: histidine phosphatase family protein [Synergistaceae bacterium]|nr:histidine phosphatase family protein [Synergistaceae bacterium]